MKTRIILLATLLALGLVAFDGAATTDGLFTHDAAASCVEIDGQCENPCLATTAVYEFATGKDAPWECPM